jgi:4-oxalocrotonate tautomerase
MPLIQIMLLAGRDAEQKKALLSAVTAAAHESIGAPVESIRVWIVETQPDGFMTGGVLAADRNSSGK